MIPKLNLEADIDAIEDPNTGDVTVKVGRGLRDLVEHLKHAAHDPIPMLLWCPECGNRHVDRGEFATKPHHTHACQECGHVWRPSLKHTVGVQFLPGFRDEP